MTSSNDPDNGFVLWLQDQLTHNGWTAQELADRSGLAQATVSNVLARKRSAGVEFARAIAAALGVSQLEVFSRAGLFDEELLDDEKASREYLRLLAAIPNDDDRQIAIDTVAAVLKTIAERSKANKPKSTNPLAANKGKA